MKRAGLHSVWIGVLVLVSVAHAGPEIAFNPSPLVFNPVVVGEDRDTTLVVKNIGDTTLVVSAISLALMKIPYALFWMPTRHPCA